jgi:DNA (cytosine-5)-methyltransferase 1
MSVITAMDSILGVIGGMGLNFSIGVLIQYQQSTNVGPGAALPLNQIRRRNSVMVNQQRNDEGLRELALFAGAGGGILGGHLLGWRTVCAVEYNAYARSVLLARQNDGTLAPFPVWDDVRTFDGRPWRGLVDVVSGGFPCQDISAAGAGAGIDGERSGLWRDFARIIGEVRPRYAFIENSPMLVTRGLDRVLCDLAKMGFDAQWGVISAENTGAPHIRERIWIVADARCELREAGMESVNSRASCIRQQETEKRGNNRFEPCMGAATFGRLRSWSAIKPGLARMAHGVAYCSDRTVAIGNGQVPIVAATAFNILSGS